MKQKPKSKNKKRPALECLLERLLDDFKEYVLDDFLDGHGEECTALGFMEKELQSFKDLMKDGNFNL